MTPFEIVTAILNLLALILIPIIAVIIGQHLQNVSAKRKDKMDVFKTMMMNRIGWSVESTRAMNIIDGHPMLLRLACSYINRQYNDPDKRPVTVTADNLKKLQDDIDVELAYYFRHIVSEIQKFYPEEYEMFELLASGQTSDFVELSAITEYS